MASNQTISATQRRAAKEFVKRWQAKEGKEEQESRSFWIDFLDVLGVPNAQRVLEFERPIRGRKIDIFYEDMGILIEQKGRGISLDEASKRSDKAGFETPFQQAKWYADHLPYSIKPHWIITCNFDEFRIYDLEYPEEPYTQVLLEDLPDSLHVFDFFTDSSYSKIVQERDLSIEAGEIVGKIYRAFARQYKNIETSQAEQHSLNVLLERIVFLLYAEDADLLHEHLAFYKYLNSYDTNQMRAALIALFKVLNTPEDQRNEYLDDELAVFPYIDGGLFEEENIIIPQFTDQLRRDLLLNASQKFDWKDVNPTIFGAVFESTLNPDTRRSGGMHYTSVENIHKVIDPLFLDDLKAELGQIEGIKVKRDREQKLRTYQHKLASLKFLDPAAGSHNFLTETFISLRKLEIRVIEDLLDGQTAIDIDDPILVTIDQFYGIEINEFAVSVGKTALWIAERQMMARTQEMLPFHPLNFLPLKSYNNSHCANALCIDWNDVLPAEQCNYILGNPPFIGARNQTKEQKAELEDVFHGAKNCGNIDYVAGWYMKAALYSAHHPIRCAFVSTNSICQGEQVANIWKPLHDLGIHIDFAHDTFRWVNEANDQAHVFVVIVGFSRELVKKYLFHHPSPDEEAIVLEPKRINAYLADAPDVFIWNRNTPICNLPKIGIGSQPIDDGNYLFKEDEKEAFLQEEPEAKRFFHPWLGSQEFIKGIKRWVLWLGEATDKELQTLPKCRERVNAVRKYRSNSDRTQTKKAAKRPKHFGTEIITESTSILIPEVSSERRFYIPMGFIGPETFCSNLVRLIPNATIYHYGILQSQFHNAWIRAVCGRLKSDYRYSGGVVYNNYPWPYTTPENITVPVEEAVPTSIRKNIEQCAQAILDVRAEYPDSSLADLYDPDKMPYDLLAAHEALDAAVEEAYGVNFNGDEEKIIAYLFELYAQLTEEK